MKQNKIFLMMSMLLVVLMGACKKDSDPGVRPVVTSTDPISSAIGITLNRKIMATFSVPMSPTTISSSSFTLQQGTTAVAGSVVYTGLTATFTPTANLAVSTVYTATVNTGAKSLGGTSMAKNYTWNFTTGTTPDTTAPTVTLTNPANNATGVAVNRTVVVTFSEAMDFTTITSSTIAVKQGTTPVAGVVTYTGTTATFTPTGNLLPNTVYTVTVSTGAKDLSGNGLTTNNVTTFTTAPAPDTTLPTINALGPLSNATGVSLNKVVSVVFSEAMDPLTITGSTFTLKQGAATVAGTVAYSGTTATFTSTNNLTASTLYTATITNGAKDLAGNSLAGNTVWSFTTGTTVSTLGPVGLGAAGDYVILAKTTVTNIATSAITGDLGLSPAATSFFTGFALTNATGYATSAQVTGKLFAADMAPPTSTNLTTAVNNMLTAYTDAAGRPNPDFSELYTGNLGGKTLTPGLYKWTTAVTMPANLVISGDATDVWIFQIAGNLTMSNAVMITLQGGAQAKNIFWQVAGQATMGTTSHFEGIILSQTSITFQTGSSMNGRALAQTAVILDANAITKPN